MSEAADPSPVKDTGKPKRKIIKPRKGSDMEVDQPKKDRRGRPKGSKNYKEDKGKPFYDKI